MLIDTAGTNAFHVGRGADAPTASTCPVEVMGVEIKSTYDLIDAAGEAGDLPAATETHLLDKVSLLKDMVCHREAKSIAGMIMQVAMISDLADELKSVLPNGVDAHPEHRSIRRACWHLATALLRADPAAGERVGLVFYFCESDDPMHGARGQPVSPEAEPLLDLIRRTRSASLDTRPAGEAGMSPQGEDRLS